MTGSKNYVYTNIVNCMYIHDLYVINYTMQYVHVTYMYQSWQLNHLQYKHGLYKLSWTFLHCKWSTQTALYSTPIPCWQWWPHGMTSFGTVYHTRSHNETKKQIKWSRLTNHMAWWATTDWVKPHLKLHYPHTRDEIKHAQWVPDSYTVYMRGEMSSLVGVWCSN